MKAVFVFCDGRSVIRDDERYKTTVLLQSGKTMEFIGMSFDEHGASIGVFVERPSWRIPEKVVPEPQKASKSARLK